MLSADASAGFSQVAGESASSAPSPQKGVCPFPRQDGVFGWEGTWNEGWSRSRRSQDVSALGADSPPGPRPPPLLFGVCPLLPGPPPRRKAFGPMQTQLADGLGLRCSRYFWKDTWGREPTPVTRWVREPRGAGEAGTSSRPATVQRKRCRTLPSRREAEKPVWGGSRRHVARGQLSAL